MNEVENRGSELFRTLPPEQQAVVAAAVLLDGFEAVDFLSVDSIDGALLSEAAAGLAALEPELRMPFVGTLLRRALEQIQVK